jgi:hypothetical protein
MSATCSNRWRTRSLRSGPPRPPPLRDAKIAAHATPLAPPSTPTPPCRFSPPSTLTTRSGTLAAGAKARPAANCRAAPPISVHSAAFWAPPPLPGLRSHRGWSSPGALAHVRLAMPSCPRAQLLVVSPLAPLTLDAHDTLCPLTRAVPCVCAQPRATAGARPRVQQGRRFFGTHSAREHCGPHGPGPRPARPRGESERVPQVRAAQRGAARGSAEQRGATRRVAGPERERRAGGEGEQREEERKGVGEARERVHGGQSGWPSAGTRQRPCRLPTRSGERVKQR